MNIAPVGFYIKSFKNYQKNCPKNAISNSSSKHISSDFNSCEHAFGAYNFSFLGKNTKHRKDANTPSAVCSNVNRLLKKDRQEEAAKMLFDFYRKNGGVDSISSLSDVQEADFVTKNYNFDFRYKISPEIELLIRKNKMGYRNKDKLFYVCFSDDSIEKYNKINCFAYYVDELSKKAKEKFESENIESCIELMSDFYKNNGGYRGISNKIGYQYNARYRNRENKNYGFGIETNNAKVLFGEKKLAIFFIGDNRETIITEFDRNFNPKLYHAKNYSADVFCFCNLISYI